MIFTPRQRFIALASLGYAVFALAWIFLSDQLLAEFTDLSRIVWLSTAKGVAFVFITTAMLFFALRAVPAADALRAVATPMNGLRPLLGWPRWLQYGFALVSSLSFAFMHFSLAHGPETPVLQILILPIIVSAAIGGLWPGLWATALGASASLLLMPPEAAAQLLSIPSEKLRWVFLLANGLLISVLCETLHRAWFRLEASRSTQAAILRSVGDAIIAVDERGQISYLNPEAERITGWPMGEALGQEIGAVLRRSGQNAVHAAALSGDLTLIRRDEAEIPVSLRETAIHHDDGRAAGRIFAFSDERERRRMEAALQHQHDLLKDMSAMAELGAWEVDAASLQGPLSEEVARICGLDAAAQPPLLFGPHLFSERWRLLFESAMARLFGEGSACDMVLALQTPGGVEKWVRLVAEPVLVEGHIVAVRGAMQDISAQRRAEDALRESEARYARVIEGSEQGFWVWNVQTNQFDISPRFASMLGYQFGKWDISPARWVDYLQPQDLARAQASIEAHLAGRTPLHEVEFRIRTASGQWKWILTRGRIVERDAEGRPLIMAGTHTDIAARKETELALRRAAAVFQNAREGVVITDAELRIVMTNAAFTEITGYSEAEVLGKPGTLMRSNRHDEAFFKGIWEAVAQHGHWQGEYWGQIKDGRVAPVWLSISVVRDEQGEVCNYVQVFSDISSLKASEERLDHLAHHDALTQLPNRLLLFTRLEHALAMAQRDGSLLALLMFDLDRFKDINDSFGHLVGDQLLQLLADRMGARLRKTDFFARLGGDEFTILLENLTRLEDAARVAEELIHSLETPFQLPNGIEVQCSVSIGISLFPGYGETAEALLQQADAAMYRAKAEGRGRFQYYSSSMTDAARDRISIDARLRRAITRGELFLHYQPQIELHSGRIVGAEALVRWQDPVEGLLAPARFIPIAEETGLIRELGAWVLREACRQGRAWLDAGLPPLRLAVNVSAQQIRHGQFDQLVEQVLRETGFPANLLELELTESVLMDAHSEVARLLDNLRARQIRIAIDDFGTGYSSLVYLKRFPLDVLKIDKGFVDGLVHDRDDRAITLAIISMARALGFKVLAEGVEDPEQLMILQAHGCDLYQGYFFSKPLPAQEFVQRLQVQPVS
ncbi:EAL domain-containing protein [Uliginosibacterium aquaticum]|uniref:EAL domain-containing protein n=1 Tax=Uliginosibacterium aquaticum TaxID=2731212 RepID=A0ABX2IGN5_9RHOO|nr:EAL domain-containing protein [Uliginosibacterium aquaticum]NSL53784.1 EAL domain-containing protein [Uliginosibacterium aquaticum]